MMLDSIQVFLNYMTIKRQRLSIIIDINASCDKEGNNFGPPK